MPETAPSKPNKREIEQLLALAKIMIPWPEEGQEEWLERERKRRFLEAKALGADDRQAAGWAATVDQLVRGLIQLADH